MGFTIREGGPSGFMAKMKAAGKGEKAEKKGKPFGKKGDKKEEKC